MIKEHRGYTFLELMVTVSILVIGIVGVYKVLLSSLDYQTQLSCRLYAMNLIEDELTLIENQFKATGQFPIEEDGKVVDVVLDRRNVSFEFSLLLAGVEQDIAGLIPAEVIVSWNDRDHEIKLKRDVYFANLNIKPPSDAISNL